MVEPGIEGLRLPLGEDLVAGHVHARGAADTEGSSLSPCIKRRIRAKTSLAEIEKKERGRTNIPGPGSPSPQNTSYRCRGSANFRRIVGTR